MVEKWCYFFKYAEETSESDLKKILTGGDVVIKDAYSALDKFNWNEQELIAYEQEIKRIWDNAAVEEAKLDAAESRGREEGKKARDMEIARNLLSVGVGIDVISSATGLLPEEIQKLKP